MLKKICDNLAPTKHVGVNTLIVTSPTLRPNLIAGKVKLPSSIEQGYHVRQDHSCFFCCCRPGRLVRSACHDPAIGPGGCSGSPSSIGSGPAAVQAAGL